MKLNFEIEPFNGDTFLEKEFLRLKEEYKIKNIVETGTFHGHTTCWFAMNFDKVYTSEVKQEYYQISDQRFKDNGFENINNYLGDSVQILPAIITTLKKSKSNNIFFLDAHWYTNPLLGELKQIADSGYKPQVICIHDMKNPNDPTMGYDQYPDQGISYSFEWVRPFIEAIYGESGYRHYFNKEAAGARRGALFIEPISNPK